jgi:anti-sigma B factor antagonist
MAISTSEYNRCNVVKMDGRLDSSNGDELHDVFKSIINAGTSNLVFDMGDVDFMSSKGWWVLIETQKACKAKKGKIVLANVPDKIKTSLDLVGMTDYFNVFDDLTSAVGSF